MRTSLALVTVILASSGQAAEPFERVRAELSKKLRDKSDSTRAGAVRDLGNYPVTEAAKMAFAAARDPAAEVRAAVPAALVKQSAVPLVRTWMTDRVNRNLENGNAVLAVALFAAGGDTARVTKAVNRVAKDKPAAVAELVAATDDLRSWPDPAAVAALQRLSELDCFPLSVPLRRAVAHAAIGLRVPEAVPLVIDLLKKVDPQADGEILANLVAHLGHLSGSDFGVNPDRWREWWAKARAGFRFPDPGAARKPAGGAAKVNYYGIPVYARRVVFVIDVSGSMAGPKLDAAKKELIAAVTALPPAAEFNVVSFSTAVVAWNPKPVPATPEAKGKTVQFVTALQARGATNTHDALLLALSMKVEAVYLLTDGEPTGDPDAIAASVKAQNRLVGSSIHTIGILPQKAAAAEPFARFLWRLSDENYGVSRKAD